MIAPIHLTLAGCVSVCFKGEGGGGLGCDGPCKYFFQVISLLIKVLIISTKKKTLSLGLEYRLVSEKREMGNLTPLLGSFMKTSIFFCTL